MKSEMGLMTNRVSNEPNEGLEKIAKYEYDTYEEAIHSSPVDEDRNVVSVWVEPRRRPRYTVRRQSGDVSYGRSLFICRKPRDGGLC